MTTRPHAHASARNGTRPAPDPRTPAAGAESARLAEDVARTANWKRWGPYLAERQWATVREDYSADGDCWSYFPHDHARSRAYRWGEDGLLGICDRECRLCFALALWNGEDPILKERLFGLTGPEGNHGEDVKEEYFYLDSTPTHSYMRALYKYPQRAFPYAQLVRENASRPRTLGEFELADTGAFDNGRYFDVQAEYAKASPGDICIRLTVTNRGPARASLTLLPQLWFRNAWSWGCTHEGCERKPWLRAESPARIAADHASLGRCVLHVGPGPAGEQPRLLFTENVTNRERLYNAPSEAPFVKDAFHRYVIGRDEHAVNPRPEGTKAAAPYTLDLAPGASAEIRLRLREEGEQAPPAPKEPLGPDFAETFAQRTAEADAFYAPPWADVITPPEHAVARQAFAGLLWSKQFYHYVVQPWLTGDPGQPPPPPGRARNAEWRHVFCRDVLSMPDKWEYPWFAAWDTAFHMVALARVDPQFAKDQLLLFLREWYMHPNGQIPAYEFAFSDVNPPVHAWACWRVYKVTAPRGKRDRTFLARAFHKLLLNFTWWVNRKDPDGRNLFSGGFLGLDNIGVFDRSRPLPTGGCLEQADGTAWMAFYCGTMLSMALELASEDPAYEDVASKFFEHFVAITDAMNTLGGTGLWDENDGFYYDQVSLHGRALPMRIRSLVGVVPLLAVEVLEESLIQRLPGFRKRMHWFLDNRRDLARHIAYMVSDNESGPGCPEAHRLLAIPSRERLERVLRYVLDESEFLSPFGVRSLSRFHRDHPFSLDVDGNAYTVSYEPGESTTGIFGGNSNWRGPVWFPLNFLLIEALERYHHFYGDSFTIECPTGSGKRATLEDVADELRRRLVSLFLPDSRGHRPCHAGQERYAADPNWNNLVLFHEYFHGETGAGLGASHQTGWTALVLPILQDIWRTRAGRAKADAVSAAT